MQLIFCKKIVKLTENCVKKEENHSTFPKIANYIYSSKMQLINFYDVIYLRIDNIYHIDVTYFLWPFKKSNFRRPVSL